MIRFYNGSILTFENGSAQLSAAELWTDGGVIAHIGAAPAGTESFEREIDLRGNLLLPGFKNAHTHSGMTFLRSLTDDLPLQEWLFNKIFPYEAKLDAEAIYYFTKLANLEYLAGGVTAAFDMYFYRDTYVQACIDSGFRTVLCGALMQFDGDFTVTERDFEKYNRIHPLIGYRLGIHAEYTSNVELRRYIKSLIDANRASFWTHHSETASETAECMERNGCTPTELFEREGMYIYGGGGFHCVHFSENDMRIFRDNGLWAVTCPCSNAKLASGTADLMAQQRMGVLQAIGTDGPSSNNGLDMFREMYLACVLQKLRYGDATAMNPERVLEMACCCGARAMGLNDCDALAVGKRADIIAIDMSMPNMQPVHHPAKNLVYSGNPGNVCMTMIDGRILYENGEYFLDESAEDICRRAGEHAGRIIAQV